MLGLQCALKLQASTGNACKVSRQHAFIQLRKDGKFYLRNIGTFLSRLAVRLALTPPATAGRRVVLVNNLPIESGQRAQLPPDCLIEIGGLYFIFMPNNRRKERPRPATPTAAEQPAGDAVMQDEPSAEPAAVAAEPAAEPTAEPAAEPEAAGPAPAEPAAEAEEPPAAAMTTE